MISEEEKLEFAELSARDVEQIIDTWMENNESNVVYVASTWNEIKCEGFVESVYHQTGHPLNPAWGHFEKISEFTTIDGLGDTYLEDSYGGQGQGDEYWLVIRVENGGKSRWFKKPGYYQSYSGGELDGNLYEVFPKQKTVTVWEKR